MNLKHRWKYFIGLPLLICPVLFAADRPNILWITAEDMSANLGCYGDSYARTPNLDRFARESIRYTRAFATAPVCSPARSTLITGCYATSLGTQRLRSAFPIPEHIQGFPSYLRQLGFFTSNNVKTDYNIAAERDFISKNWNRNVGNAHWRQRGPDQPFFSIFNLMTTHQSRANVWSWEQFENEVGSRLSAAERHDPAKAPLPSYYPDTPLVRRTVARYYDCITVMDKEVGQLLRQLDEDGLADNTIVFFYSDHGMGMPRGKRLLHDSGMHVPLLIRFPEKWRHLAPADSGEVSDRLVSFVDFAPTVLSLVDFEIPGHMQGEPFLGKQATAPRRFVFGARDRVDEVFELSRSIRDDRFLLIENYMPHLSWMPPERYSDNAEMRRELKQLSAAGRLNAAQLTYAAPKKPPIEFYDAHSDPDQIHNLAERSEHRERIAEMARALQHWQRDTVDLGCFTEPMIWHRLDEYRTPWEFGRNRRGAESWRRGWQAARFALQSQGQDIQRGHLKSDEEVVRYWGVSARTEHSVNSPEIAAAFATALNDSSHSVRIEAASVILETRRSPEAMKVLVESLEHPTVEIRLHAVRSLELLGHKATEARPAIETMLSEAVRREQEHPCWMFVRFSAEAALENFERSQR